MGAAVYDGSNRGRYFRKTSNVNRGHNVNSNVNRGQATVFLRPIAPTRKTVQVGDFQCWTTI
jgi:hypothetical protein